MAAALAAQEMTQTEAAGRLHVPLSTLNGILRGRQGVTQTMAELLRDNLGIDPSWLLFGDEAADPASTAGCVHDADGHYTTVRPIRVPLVGRVSANPAPDVIWEAVEPPEYRELPRGAVALEVRGDSMRPVAMPGQAVIAVELPIENGDLAAVEMKDGRQLFKRWWWREGRKAAILESVRREAIEPPVPVRLRDCLHVWKVIGVLF